MIAVSILQNFSCTADGFLAAAPYIECGSFSLSSIEDSTWAWLFYTSLVAAVVYVAGFPLLWLALLLHTWRRRSMYKRDVRNCIGFLYVGFRSSCWMWYLVQTVRLIALVATAAFTPQGSLARLLTIGAIFLGSLVLHLLVQPYASRVENYAETFSLSMLILVQASTAYVETVAVAETYFGQSGLQERPLNVEAAINFVTGTCFLYHSWIHCNCVLIRARCTHTATTAVTLGVLLASLLQPTFVAVLHLVRNLVQRAFPELTPRIRDWMAAHKRVTTDDEPGHAEIADPDHLEGDALASSWHEEASLDSSLYDSMEGLVD